MSENDKQNIFSGVKITGLEHFNVADVTPEAVTPYTSSFEEALERWFPYSKKEILQAHNSALAEAKREAVLWFIDHMLLDERGNDEAGHRWSRSDFMKYLEAEREALDSTKEEGE